VLAAGALQLPNHCAGAAACRRFWTLTLRSTLAVSGVASRGNDDTAAAVTETAQSAHVNAIWSPVPKTNFGLEYLYRRRSTHDGANGRLNRVQLGARYFF
jgi:DcaP outer membrane protein